MGAARRRRDSGLILGRRTIGLIAVASAAAMVALARPFAPGLSPTGHAVLAAVLAALGMWIFRPGNLPFMAGSATILALALTILFAARTTLLDPATGYPYTSQALFAIVAGGFASSSFWTLIPALYFGFVLQKTGLGKRVAYLVLKSFSPSWGSIALSWLIIGLILSALTPSITVRVAIMLPIAMSIVDACKLEPRSRGSAYVCLLAWGMAVFPGTGWMTGTLSGPIIQGFLPAELKPMANFDDWFRILAPPWMVVTIVYASLAYLLARPREAIGISRNVFSNEYAKLGALSRDELRTLVILALTLALFATERLHGIPIAATALGALLLFTLTGIVGGAEISAGINWDAAVFFGVAVALPGIFGVSGISAWFSPIVGGPILGLASSPLAFILVITLGLMLIRFVDVPWGYTTCALTVFLLVPLSRDFGYHPLVVSMAYLASVNFFLLSYQQPWIMMSDGMMGGRGWASAHVAIYGGIYVVSVIVALLLAVPYWRMIGVIA
ncbi:MAG: anion permease [Spirochaetaceae bacterium]|nr:anion permease [Spirochaetaceae bacterium]